MLQQGAGLTYFDKYPVQITTTYGLLVRLERSGVIADADEVFASIRGLGASLVPSPHPKARRAENSD